MKLGERSTSLSSSCLSASASLFRGGCLCSDMLQTAPHSSAACWVSGFLGCYFGFLNFILLIPEVWVFLGLFSFFLWISPGDQMCVLHPWGRHLIHKFWWLCLCYREEHKEKDRLSVCLNSWKNYPDDCPGKCLCCLLCWLWVWRILRAFLRMIRDLRPDLSLLFFWQFKLIGIKTIFIFNTANAYVFILKNS